MQAAKGSEARFLNESTVGAGLPIVAPLKVLLATGDKVRFILVKKNITYIYAQVKKIESVFCATMSDIFVFDILGLRSYLINRHPTLPMASTATTLSRFVS